MSFARQIRTKLSIRDEFELVNYEKVNIVAAVRPISHFQSRPFIIIKLPIITIP